MVAEQARTESINTDYALAFQCAFTPAFGLFERRLPPCG
jgi:hypothetical protein